jgi:argininosuccinate synthase
VTAPPLVFAFEPSTPAAALAGVIRRHGPAVTLTLDLGGGEEIDAARDRALDAGAQRAHVVDARAELARGIVRPALAAGALSPRVSPALLALPALARHLVAVARMEGASTVGHALDGTEADVLGALVRSLAPDLTVIGPDGDAPGPAARVVSTLWGRSVTLPEGTAPPGRLFTRTREPGPRSAEPAVVEIAIQGGVPTAVNGIALELEELVEIVSTIAGDHGVGRFDAVTTAGRAPTRAIVELPAAVVLAEAVEELAALALDPATLGLRRQFAPIYTGLLASGLWHTPARAALDAFTAASAAPITGTVSLQLAAGACRTIGRRLGALEAEPAPCAPQG